MIHRFIDLFEDQREPDLVFLALESSPSSKHVLWKAGNLATPARLSLTAINTGVSVEYLADTELSPDGTEVLYCRVTNLLSGALTKQCQIRKVQYDDSADVVLHTDTGAVESLQPTWRHDGGEILFRAKGSTTTLDRLKVMAPDGTGVSTIYTSTGNVGVNQPLYSWDNSKIAWVEQPLSGGYTRLIVANADGSSPATVHSETSPASVGEFSWGRESGGAAVLYFTRRASSAFSTTDWSWRKVNADGTGLTILFAIDRSSGYGAGDVDPSAFKWSALPAGQGVVTTIQDNPAVEDHNLTKIDASGTKTTYSPTRVLPTGTPDFRPAFFGGGRIYFADANPATQLASIKLDGSDYRVDFTGSLVGPSGSSVTFHGFKGDTLNI